MPANLRLVTGLVMTGLLLAAPFSYAKDGDAKPPKLFAEPGEMNVTLSGPWNRIKKNIEVDKLYPARLTYTGADGQQHEIDLEVSPRGLTRRLRVCDFPPLKVHFDKKKMKGTEFRGNKSLKLVTYCDTNTKYEQYYIKEFLVYRIYNLLTEYSFRVRPMTITYEDSEKRKSSITRFGFLIEDVDDVAKRNDLKKLSIEKIPYKQLDPDTIGKASLFQYLVGNLDWSAIDAPGDESCCHNAKLIGAGNDAIPKYVVPYDFDSTGLVNAHYALPPNGLNVRNIRQRLYRGFCLSNDLMPQHIAFFNEKNAEVLSLFNDNSKLTDRNRKAAIKYIEEFYEVINDPKKLQKEITGKCRGEAL
jgi:hypothetical protein